MKANTCLVIDVWEGQLEIDEAVLKANGVAGIGIRLNDMNGGHHMDSGFAKQWKEAVNFVRFPYFVYNPWVDGAANFAWLAANMPVEAKSVAIDVEVRYSGITANKYAGELVRFLDLCKSKWRTIIYTAQWFLPYLSSWPRVDYWWAQYPDPAAYFSGVKTWDELKVRLDRLDRPFNASAIPGTLKMWQFSGDYLVLPGNSRDMDVNLFYGSAEELAAYFESTASEPGPDPEPEPEPKPDPIVRSGLYTFSGLNYFARPGGGPLTLPMSRVRRLGDNLTRYSWAALKPILQALNPTNRAAVDLISAPDWGPSKGLDGDYIKWIGLLWPGRNVVRVAEVVDGWGRVEGIPMHLAGTLNATDNPDSVHLVYDFNKNSGYGERKQPVYVPIMGGPWWVDMGRLLSVDAVLPRKVRVTAFPALNVRSAPSIVAPIVGRRFYGLQEVVTSVAVGKGGLWGRIAGGYIALRNNGKNLTDWKI